METLLTQEEEHQNIPHLQRALRVQRHLLREPLRITTLRLTHRLRDQHLRTRVHLIAVLRDQHRLIVRRVTVVHLRLLDQHQRIARLLTARQHIALPLEQVHLRTALPLTAVLHDLLHQGKDHDVA